MAGIQFGQAITDVASGPHPVGTIISVTFQSACPRNYIKPGGTFLTVDRLDEATNEWQEVVRLLHTPPSISPGRAIAYAVSSISPIQTYPFTRVDLQVTYFSVLPSVPRALDTVMSSGCPLVVTSTRPHQHSHQLTNCAWSQVLTDNDISTKFAWARPHHLSSESTATITWDIEPGTPSGTYRIRHFGAYKHVLDGTTPFSGSSGVTFSVRCRSDDIVMETHQKQRHVLKDSGVLVGVMCLPRAMDSVANADADAMRCLTGLLRLCGKHQKSCGNRCLIWLRHIPACSQAQLLLVCSL